MENRYRRLADECVTSLVELWEKDTRDLPFILLVFDEFADLVLGDKDLRKEFENLAVRICIEGPGSRRSFNARDPTARMDLLFCHELNPAKQCCFAPWDAYQATGAPKKRLRLRKNGTAQQRPSLT